MLARRASFFIAQFPHSGGHLLSRISPAKALLTLRLAARSRHVWTVSSTYRAMSSASIGPCTWMSRSYSQAHTLVAFNGSFAVSVALISFANESPGPGPSAATDAGGLGSHAKAAAATQATTPTRNRGG